jgi:hypothetical protein
MLHLDLFHATQVGDRAGDLQDSVVAARRKREASHGHFQHPFTCLIKGTQLSQPTRRNLGFDESAGRLPNPRL